MSFFVYDKFLGVQAFTTDRSVDFFRGDPACLSGHFLTVRQREVLEPVLGHDGTERLIFPKQVHGDAVWRVTAKEAGQRGSYEADAVVTDVPGLPIAIRTADCLPLLMVDARRGVAAAVHAGWKSTRLLIAARAVGVMVTSYGVKPQDIRAVIGPCIRTESCQVGPEFSGFFPGDVVQMRDGWHLDLAGANIRQLLGAGLIKENIFDCGQCTFKEQGLFFSYRRENENAGRMLHAIMLPAH